MAHQMFPYFLRRLVLGCTLAVFTLNCGLALAQLSTGSIVGTVEDSSGAVLPGVSVKAVQAETGLSRSVTTNAGGAFTFNSMAPGSYTLTFTASGFKTKDLKRLVLTTGETLPVPAVRLEVGGITQTVTTYAQAAAVKTATSDRSELISSTQVQNLVARGRNFTDLTTLLPGVLNTTKSTDISTTPTIYVNGNRNTTNAVFIDGIPSNDMGNGAMMKDMISQDALSEVKVETSNYEAQYGREGGSNIIAVTKSGTREFHGLLSYFNRNEIYNANNYFNNLNRIRRPRYRYNTITYNIGGPIYIPHVFNRDRSKLFFFWNQEFWPTKITSTGSVTVPTALEREGDFSQSYQPNGQLYAVTDPFNHNARFPGNKIPSGELDQNGIALLKIFPLPNFTNLAVSKGNYNYVFSSPVQTPLTTQTLSIDYNPRQQDTFSGSYNAYNNHNTGSVGATANPFNFPLMVDTYFSDSKAASFRWMHIFNASMLNEFHLGYLQQPAGQTYTANELQKATRTSVGMSLGQFYPSANPLNIIPNASFGGVPNAATIKFDGRFPLYNRYYLYNLSDDLSYTVGQHNLKAGVYFEIFRRHQKIYGLAPTGSFSFANDKSNPFDTGYAYANAALGTFDTYQESSVPGWQTAVNTDFEVYAQDSWRITRKLTINYGLRAYYAPPYVEKNNQISGFVFGQYDPAKAVKLIQPALVGKQRVGIDPGTGKQYPAADIGAISPSIGDPTNGMVTASNRGSLPRSLTPSAGWQLGPRVGFAFDPRGDGKTAIRAGFGIFQTRPQETPFFDDLTAQPPLAEQPQVTYGQLSNVFSSSGLFFPNNVYGPDVTGHLSMVMNYSLGIQRAIGFDTILDISYVGSQGRHLDWFVDQNSIPLGADFLPENRDPTKPGSPLPSAFYRPVIGYNSIYQLSNGANSNYNALQASLQRRFAHVLTFGAAYTWSKTMDYADTIGSIMTRVVPTRAYYYSLASFDAPQILVINALYDLPRVPWRNAFADRVLGNWQLSGIGSFQSGLPNGITVTTTNGEDITGTTSVTPRAVVHGNANLQKGQRTFAHYFNTDAIQLPAVGTWGNAPRLFIRGPGVNDWDLALMKNIQLHDRLNLQLRWEAYNALNHTQFSTVNTTPRFNPASGIQTNTQFGQVTAARDPRQMQVAVRVTF